MSEYSKPAQTIEDYRLSDEIGQFTTVPFSFIQSSKSLSSDAKWLFVILRHHTNSRTGNSFPSYDTITAETGLHRRKISKALKELIGAGWLEKKRRFSRSTLYTLRIPSPISTAGGTTDEHPISTAGGTIISANGVTTISDTVGTLTRSKELDKRELEQVSSKEKKDPPAYAVGKLLKDSSAYASDHCTTKTTSAIRGLKTAPSNKSQPSGFGGLTSFSADAVKALEQLGTRNEIESFLSRVGTTYKDEAVLNAVAAIRELRPPVTTPLTFLEKVALPQGWKPKAKTSARNCITQKMAMAQGVILSRANGNPEVVFPEFVSSRNFGQDSDQVARAYRAVEKTHGSQGTLDAFAYLKTIYPPRVNVDASICDLLAEAAENRPWLKAA